MTLTTEERKARREAGVARANGELTTVQRIHRALINGRPPASELRTPTAAVTAARTLYRDIERRLIVEGFAPKPCDWAVSVGYVTPDLSVVGFSVLYAPGREADLMSMLDGQIMLGLVFGIADGEGTDGPVMGTRPFMSTKQVDGWLNELITPVQMEMADPA